MTLEHRHKLKEKTKEMIYHAFNGYMENAFPSDELRPESCVGIDRDYKDVFNYGMNDKMGNFTLTLIDSLDALAVIGDKKAFEKAIKDVIKTVNFNQNNKVQIFEVNIRILGGLLSAHLFAINEEYGMKLDNYNNELLDLAYDLGIRLLPAFKYSESKIPLTRVNLKKGYLSNENGNCSAGAGTFIIEFGTLSRLTGDKRFEMYARDALFEIWEKRSKLNLVGNSINSHNAEWINNIGGIGAGIDSFYEYLLKGYIYFGDSDYLEIFNEAYKAVLTQIKNSEGLYLDVNINNGSRESTSMDSLSAFFPGVQVLKGDIQNAIHLHQIYVELWKKFHGIPERYNFYRKEIEVDYYPLRPEFIESNYMLYQATKDPYYLEIGEMILNDIEKNCKAKCGYSSLNPLSQLKKDDRMESFFISESLKYLYLLFDEENIINTKNTNAIFTTEGHFMLLPKSAYFNNEYNKVTRKNKNIENEMCPKLIYNLAKPLLTQYQKERIYSLVNHVNKNKYNEVCPITADLKKVDLYVDSESTVENPVYPKLDFLETKKYYLLNTLSNTNIELSHYGNEILLSRVNRYNIKNNKPVYIIKQGIEFLLSQETSIKNLKVYTLSLDGYENIKISAAKAFFGPQLDLYQDWKIKIVPLLEHAKTANSSLIEGCDEYSEIQQELVKNKVVMVRRGGCFFSQKTLLAMRAGASGVIVSNFDDKIFNMSPYKPPFKSRNIENEIQLKYEILMKESKEIIENNIPINERKVEDDEFTIPTIMISRKSAEIIMKIYENQFEKERKNRNNNNNTSLPSPVMANLSWNIGKPYNNDKERVIELRYDNKVINNIVILMTRKDYIVDIKKSK